MLNKLFRKLFQANNINITNIVCFALVLKYKVNHCLNALHWRDEQ